MTRTQYSVLGTPSCAARSRRTRGFTLMELLIVILIIGLLAGLSVAALAGAAEQARASRTRSIVNKLDQLVMAKYESYRTRTLPIRTTSLTTQAAATARLLAMQELMRLELPDRISDLCDAVEIGDLTSGDSDLDLINSYDARRVALATPPAIVRAYKRKVAASIASHGPWTAKHQYAECLYLIVSTMHDGDKNALDFFGAGEIGDEDEDGMKEIHDGWGQPIYFLRWAPGYSTQQKGVDDRWGDAGVDDNGNSTTDEFAEWMATGSDDWQMTVTPQSRDWTIAPNPFDPLKLNPTGYAMHPLIFSGGTDRTFDIVLNDYDPTDPSITVHFSYYTHNNNPYLVLPSSGRQIGDLYVDSQGWLDNITNHYQEP